MTSAQIQVARTAGSWLRCTATSAKTARAPMAMLEPYSVIQVRKKSRTTSRPLPAKGWLMLSRSASSLSGWANHMAIMNNGSRNSTPAPVRSMCPMRKRCRISSAMPRHRASSPPWSYLVSIAIPSAKPACSAAPQGWPCSSERT